MEINVRLGGGGNGGRQGKISAKGSYSSNKNIVKNSVSGSNSTSSLKTINSGISAFTGIASGHVSSLTSATGLGSLFLATAGFDKLISFGADVYKGISGEDMLMSNLKAQSKTITTGGLNLLSRGISNMIFTQPRIRRENDMKDYGRELYLSTFEKNKMI